MGVAGEYLEAFLVMLAVEGSFALLRMTGRSGFAVEGVFALLRMTIDWGGQQGGAVCVCARPHGPGSSGRIP